MLKSSESPVKILLADDSVTMHRAVALALKKLPWQLLTCDNGQDALRIALEQRPQVVIADLDMPGMNGAELCQALREKPSLAHTRLILLCGSFDQVDESHLESIPVDGRLWKPFESHVLIALIEALLKNAPQGTSDPTALSQVTVRESSEATLPPIQETSPSEDVASKMASETFQQLPRPTPPPPSASTLKERILPVPDISPEKAMAQLWSPDLGSYEETLPPVEEEGEEASFENPGYASPQPEETEFSVYRDGPHVPLEGEENIPAAESTFEVPPPPQKEDPASQAHFEKWREDAESRGKSWDADELRALIREEIRAAFEGRLKQDLEKTLAEVLQEIDRA